MNVLAVVAEYNPMHNGHVYQINEAREKAKADFVITCMGGNFTQRGNTSIVSKFEKAKMALLNGSDMVIELPTIYSISSSENFAYGAIKILKELNFVTHISFGIEESNLEKLDKVARLLEDEPAQYSKILKEQLKLGLSFPEARAKAISKFLNDGNFEEILKGSNNILAIEYLKQIKKQRANFIPIGIKRNKVSYNSTNVIENYASSSAIRNLIYKKQFSLIKNVMPKLAYDILISNINNGSFNIDLNNYSKIIIYKLRTMTLKQIANLPDVTEGLENLIEEAAGKTNSLTELISLIKSKRYTQTRIQRILLYVLLDITKRDMEMSKKASPYIRVLGCKKKGQDLLKFVPQNKLITSVKKYESKNLNLNTKRLLEIDKLATDIYTIPYTKNSTANLDYTMPLIIL